MASASASSQGLTAEKIKDLQRLNPKVHYDMPCCVCSLELNENLSECAIWPCGHMMCKDDTEKWLKEQKKNSCPTCRRECNRIISVSVDQSGKITGTDRYFPIDQPAQYRAIGRTYYGRHTGGTVHEPRPDDTVPKSKPFSPEQIEEYTRLLSEQSSASSSEFASASASPEPTNRFGSRYALYENENGKNMIVSLDESGAKKVSATDIFLLVDTSGSMSLLFSVLLRKLNEIKSKLGKFDRLCVICYHSSVEFYCQLSPSDKLPQFGQTWNSGSTNTKLAFKTLIDTIIEGNTTKLMGSTVKVIAFTDGRADPNCEPNDLIKQLAEMDIILTIAVLGQNAPVDIFLSHLPPNKKHCIGSFIDPSEIPSSVGDEQIVAKDIKFHFSDKEIPFSGILCGGKEITMSFPIENSSIDVVSTVSCSFVDNIGNKITISSEHDPSLAIVKEQEDKANNMMKSIDGVCEAFFSSQMNSEDANAKLEEITKEATAINLGPFCEGAIDYIRCTKQSIENPRLVSSTNARVVSRQQSDPLAQKGRFSTRF